MEQYLSTGRLPASPTKLADGGEQSAYIETEVRTQYPWEILQVFSVVGTAYLLYRLVVRFLAKF